MKPVWQRILRWLAVLTMALIALVPRPVYACSCVLPDAPQTELDKATAVFVGQVLSIDVPAGQLINSSDLATVSFSISQVLKGPSTAALTVQTPRGGSSCGYSFLVNEVYVVYARGPESDLQTNLCSRTRLLSEAAEDLAVLGPGTTITPTGTEPLRSMPMAQPAGYATGWGVLALINAGLARSQHRKGVHWFLASLLLGPLATLWLVAKPPKSNSTPRTPI